MRKILLLFSLLFSIQVFSQIQLTVTIDSVIYQRIRIFSDDFVDNRFGWIREGSSDLNRIQDGFLFYSNPFEFPYYDGKAIYFNPDENFEIQAKIKFISGPVDQLNGLFWGDLIFGTKFLIGFSQLGDYAVIQNSGVDERTIVKSKVNINRSGFNELVIRKVENEYVFYINGEEVYRMTYKPFTGRYIGFFIAPKSYVQIAYLKLWKLKPKI